MSIAIRMIIFLLVCLSDLVRAANFTFEWDPVEGAMGYLVEVKESPKSLKVESFQTKHSQWVGDLPYGRYQVRVQALDKRGVGSEWSDWFPLEFLAPAPSIVSPNEVIRKSRDQKIEISWIGEGLEWKVVIENELNKLTITKETKEKNLSLINLPAGSYILTVSSEVSKETSSAKISIKDYVFTELNHLNTHKFVVGLGRSSYQYENADYLSRTQFDAGGRYLSYNFNSGSELLWADFKLTSFGLSSTEANLLVNTGIAGTQLRLRNHQMSFGIGGYSIPLYTHDQLINDDVLKNQRGLLVRGAYRFDFEFGIPLYCHLDFWDGISGRRGYKTGEFELGVGAKGNWMDHEWELSMELTNLILTTQKYHRNDSTEIQDHLNLRAFQLRASYIIENRRVEIH